MGLPKARSCREAPFRSCFFSLQMLLGLCSLGGYIHLISACRVVWFCHCQQTFSNQGRDIYPFEVYSVFQIKHIHYFQKTFWFFAEIQNQGSHQVFLKPFLMGFLDGLFLMGFPNRQRQHHIVRLHFFGQLRSIPPQFFPPG